MHARHFSRWFLIATLAFLVLASAFGVSSAFARGNPVGGCPAGFDFIYPVDQLPSSTGVPLVDGNGDGWTCVNFIGHHRTVRRLPPKR